MSVDLALPLLTRTRQAWRQRPRAPQEGDTMRLARSIAHGLGLDFHADLGPDAQAELLLAARLLIEALGRPDKVERPDA